MGFRCFGFNCIVRLLAFVTLVAVSLLPTLPAHATGKLPPTLRTDVGNEPWSPPTPGEKVIYGNDDRIDVFEETDPDRVALAASTCALIDNSRLTDNGDGTFTIALSDYTIGGLQPCAGEAFATQPVAAFCSGFMVANDMVVTAGHCINGQNDLANFSFVFGFDMIDASTPNATVDANQVYAGTDLLSWSPGGDIDHSLVQVGSPITAPGAAPLPVRRSGSIASGEPVGVIGHPSGLPKKIAFGDQTQTSDVSPTGYFVANLDTYGGNSGSPVFNQATGEVEGILVRGAQDFVTSGGCFQSNVLPDSGQGEDSTKISVILSCLFDGMCEGTGDIECNGAPHPTGTLSPTSPHYNRIHGVGVVNTNCNAPSDDWIENNMPYVAIPVVSTIAENFQAQILSSGTSVFDTTFSLYCDAFNPSNPGQNLIAFNDDFLGSFHSGFSDADNILLQANTRYWLVVSTFSGEDFDSGNFEICFGGSFTEEGATTVAPIIDAITDDAVGEGATYTGPTPTLSQGTNPITWSLSEGPLTMSINSTTGVVSWASASLVGSPHTVTIVATNSAGSDEETWELAVDSSAPIINPIPDESTVDGTIYIGPTPTLSQGSNPVTWSLVQGPPGMTISASTGVLLWSNSTAIGSPHIVTIGADNSVGSDEETWVLSVVIPPIITPIADDSVLEGTTYTAPTPTLTQGTTPVTWSLTQGPSGAQIDAFTGVVTWSTASSSGSPHTITIRATNFAGVDEISWLLSVNVIAPIIAQIGDDSVADGGAYTGPTPFLSQGTRPDIWTLSAGPPGMSIDPNTGVVSWQQSVIIGSPYGVTIRATNSAGSDEESWLLTVTPVRPIINVIADDSIQDGGDYIGPSPTLVQGTQPVTWSLVQGPSGMNIDSISGVVTWANATASGSPYNVAIRADNAVGSDVQDWLLTVVIAPLIAPIEDQSVQEGAPYTGLTPELTQGTEPLTWSLILGPVDMEIDSATGVVTWEIPTIFSSPFTIIIRAANIAGNDDQGWVLTVVPVAPIISIDPDSIDFGTINIGDTSERLVTVSNIGTATLNGSVNAFAPYEVVFGSPYSIPPGRSASVLLRFAPFREGEIENTLLFDGGGDGVLFVTATALPGTDPPDPEDAPLCEAMNDIKNQLAMLQADLGLPNDFDGDVVPESYAIALLEAGACVEDDADLAAATSNAYAINLTILDSETQANELTDYRLVIAALMSISTQTQVALFAVLDSGLSVTLTGDYVGVACDEVGCMPAAIPGKTIAEAFSVFEDKGTAQNEPYAGDGDFDEDAATNATEYQNVDNCGGTVTDFIEAATDPTSDGTICTPTDPDTGCGAAPGGTPRNRTGDLALMLIAFTGLLLTGSRRGKHRGV